MSNYLNKPLAINPLSLHCVFRKFLPLHSLFEGFTDKTKCNLGKSIIYNQPHIIFPMTCLDHIHTFWHMGLEPQYACDLGKSSQDVIMSLMHLHLRVNCANKWWKYYVWLIIYSIEFIKVHTMNKCQIVCDFFFASLEQA